MALTRVGDGIWPQSYGSFGPQGWDTLTWLTWAHSLGGKAHLVSDLDLQNWPAASRMRTLMRRGTNGDLETVVFMLQCGIIARVYGGHK